MVDDTTEPILEAARASVSYHTRRSDVGDDVEYPGYIWIDWADLVKFVEAHKEKTSGS